VTLLIVRVAVPLLVNVTTFWAPLLPTATDAQLRLVGETDAATHIAEDIRLMPAIAKVRCNNLLCRQSAFTNVRGLRKMLYVGAQLGLGEGWGVMATPVLDG
jgi:hypothetical protein